MKANQALVEKLKSKKYKISTAESITGGKLISTIIEIPGASTITEQSYIVYSDKAKEKVLGIDSKIIDKFGVVSEPVALEMVRKLKKITKSEIVISTTGEAGPNVNEKGIQVGTVCIGMIIGQKEYVTTKVFAGDRIGIIESIVDYILNDLLIRIR